MIKRLAALAAISLAALGSWAQVPTPIPSHTVPANMAASPREPEPNATTGTGNVVFSNSPVLVTPNLGVPSYIDLTHAVNYPAATAPVCAAYTAYGNGTGATAAATCESSLTVGSISFGSSIINQATQAAQFTINLKTLGAVGDGSTDDSAAFSTAVAAVNTDAALGIFECVYMPAGVYYLNAAVTQFALEVPGCAVGDGSYHTFIKLGSSFTGPVFSTDEAWILTQHSTDFNYGGEWPGTNYQGFTITGSTANTGQSGIVFYDRTDKIKINDVSMEYINGPGISVGSTLTKTQAYMRDSFISNVAFYTVGSSSAPVFQLGSTTTVGGCDATNEIKVSNVNIVKPYADGLVLDTNYQGSGCVKGTDDIQLSLIRLENPQHNGDMLRIGGTTNTGTVYNVQVYGLELVSVNSGSYGLHVAGTSVTGGGGVQSINNILVDGFTIVNGAGTGLQIDQGKNINIKNAFFAAALGTSVAVGANAACCVWIENAGTNALSTSINAAMTDSVFINPPDANLFTTGTSNYPTFGNITSPSPTATVTANSTGWTCASNCSGLQIGQFISATDSGANSVWPAFDTNGQNGNYITNIVGSAITMAYPSNASTVPGTYTVSIGTTRWSTQSATTANTAAFLNLYTGLATQGNQTWVQRYLTGQADHPWSTNNVFIMGGPSTVNGQTAGFKTNTFFAGRSSDVGAAGGVEMLEELGVNDNTGGGFGNFWTRYSQTMQLPGAGQQGTTTAWESTEYNFNPVITKSPYDGFKNGQTWNITLNVGQAHPSPWGCLPLNVENTVGCTGYNATAAGLINSLTTPTYGPNGAAYEAGFLFQYGALDPGPDNNLHPPIIEAPAGVGSKLVGSIASVAITGTAGQFSCTCANIGVLSTVKITGTAGGSGSITGYSDPTLYVVSATNGTSSFTLTLPDGTPIVTVAGSLSGLTFHPGAEPNANGHFPTPGYSYSFYCDPDPSLTTTNWTATGTTQSGTTLTIGTFTARANSSILVGDVVQNASYPATGGQYINPTTTILSNISGAGSGSTWTVSTTETASATAVTGYFKTDCLVTPGYSDPAWQNYSTNTQNTGSAVIEGDNSYTVNVVDDAGNPGITSKFVLNMSSINYLTYGTSATFIGNRTDLVTGNQGGFEVKGQDATPQSVVYGKMQVNEVTNGSGTADGSILMQVSAGGALTTEETITKTTATFVPPVAPGVYTISGLPTCSGSVNQGAFAAVSNGVASPTYLAAPSTTGSTYEPVFCNGTAWVYH